ncbi:MAG: polysaccharide deacetylase family protein [Armatimonadetes bacterium]|nr:polysaccharide deacetylase family protein [Armatimonadota bacterium]
MTDRSTFSWPKQQRCAISMTYDDAAPVQHELAAPLLAEKGLKGTFYMPAHRGVTEGIENWRRVAELGHELGSHTLFHPCRREPPERYPWLPAHYDLCDYTADRWADEIRVSNCLLRLIDQRTERTFAYPCCHTTAGRGDQVVDLQDLVLQHFVAGRGPSGRPRMVDPVRPNFGALGSLGGDRKTFEQLKHDVEEAAECGKWALFMFHGVGKGTHPIFIEADQHALFVDYLADNADTIWTSSVVEVAKYLKTRDTSARSG